MTGARAKAGLKRREFCHVCQQWRSRTAICCTKINRRSKEITFAPACRGCQKKIEAGWAVLERRRRLRASRPQRTSGQERP